MSNIEISKDFQTKVFERIRDSIGDLMTDDDLKKLVEASMQKVFFEDRVTSDSWGTKTAKPPLLTELVKELLKDQVTAAIKEWIEAHPDDVKAAIDAAIAKGMFALVQQHFESRVSGPMFELAQRLQQKGVIL